MKRQEAATLCGAGGSCLDLLLLPAKTKQMENRWQSSTVSSNTNVQSPLCANNPGCGLWSFVWAQTTLLKCYLQWEWHIFIFQSCPRCPRLARWASCELMWAVHVSISKCISWFWSRKVIFWKLSPQHLQIVQGSYTCAVCRFSSGREIVALWFHHSILYLARSTLLIWRCLTLLLEWLHMHCLQAWCDAFVHWIWIRQWCHDTCHWLLVRKDDCPHHVMCTDPVLPFVHTVQTFFPRAVYVWVFLTDMLPFACHLQSYSTLSSEVGSGAHWF